jgi:DNA-binding CsgD family transcriptional regulator
MPARRFSLPPASRRYQAVGWLLCQDVTRVEPIRAFRDDNTGVMTPVVSPQSPRTAAQCGPDGRLVGRRAELARLDAALAGLRAQGAGVVEIIGEPGIGKTRLLAEFSARAKRAGSLVLAGRATEFALQTPFGVVVEAIDDYLASIEAQQLGWIGADLLGLLAAIFPSLGQHALAQHATSVQVEQYRLCCALRALLEKITPPQGLVLVLDDMHQADEASVELVTHLLHNPLRTPTLLVLAYRPRQVSLRLSTALATPVGDGLLTRLEIGPLSAQEADELLGAGMSRWRRRALYQDSGGSPLYLHALAPTRGGGCGPLDWIGGVPRVFSEPQEGPWVDSLTPSSDVNGPMDPAVQAVLLGEFHVLSETGQLVAHAAAVAGDPFELGLVAATAGLGEGETRAALDELLAADLVRPVASSGRFCYRHPVVRRVAYEAAGAGWRLAAHARAMAALTAGNAPAVARAHHVAHAVGIGDEAAIAVLVEAARTTRSREPATTASWLGVALQRLPDEGKNTRRLELLSELAMALMNAGHVRSSRDTFHEVLRLLPPELFERRTWAVTACAIADRLLGRHAEARALLLTELTALPDVDTPEGITLKLALATIALSGSQEELDANRAWGEEALAAARRGGDTPQCATALAAVAYASVVAGDTRRAVQCVHEAVPLFDTLANDGLSQGLYSLVCLGWAELYLERYEDAIRHLEQGLCLARQAGQVYVVPDLLCPLGHAYRRLGRLKEAARTLEDSVDAALLMDDDTLQRLPLALQSYVAVLAEDYQLAERAGQRVIETAGQVNDQPVWLARSMVAWARLATSGAEGCIEQIVDAWGGPQLPAWKPPDRPEAYETLVRAELARGCVDAADRWAECAEATAAALGLNIPTGFALLARGYTLLIRDPAGSAECALAAAAAFREVGSQLEAGRAHLLAGAALAAAGEQVRALHEFSQAEALLDRCGARSLIDQALREQQQLGSNGACEGQEASGLLALSARELEVAELVAEGHTNRQIARTLRLSDKTIETHLSRTFSKLGVSSRAAVATAVTQGRGAGRPRMIGGPGRPRMIGGPGRPRMIGGPGRPRRVEHRLSPERPRPGPWPPRR